MVGEDVPLTPWQRVGMVGFTMLCLLIMDIAITLMGFVMLVMQGDREVTLAHMFWLQLTGIHKLIFNLYQQLW